MMHLLGIIRSSSTLVFLLFLANFMTRSHAQAASDSMDGESTVLGPSLENTTSENFCGPPPRLEYGLPKEEYLDKTIFPRGTEIKYVCRLGYIRIPFSSSVAKCMADTTWSLPNIFCQRRSCGNPGEVDNGEMQAENLDFGSKVTYVCNPGYKMISKRNYRDCQADGKWSNDVPQCEVISCPSPPSIENGHYYAEKEDYNYLDSVKYICRGNLVLIGKQTIACTEEGKWSSDAPTCKAVLCPNPYVDNASKYSGFVGPYNMNSIVRFQCRTGYKMIGSYSVKCNQSSKWEPELPKCLSVCSVPQVKYADLEKPISESSFLEGTTLTFKCKEGYEPVRDAVTTVTCLNFHWSPALEFCERIRCVEPEPVPHGILTSHSFRYGDIITYSCKTGYKIKNVKIRKCQSDRSWSIPIPECEAVTCANPGYVKNGWYSPQEEKYFYNDTITFNCHEGFQPVGQASITCGNDGRWNSKPECIGVCNAPPHLDYAHLAFWDKTKTTVVAGTKLEYRCIPGYYHDTRFRNTIDCLGNFTWSTISNELCKIHTCPTPRDIKNGWYDHEIKEYRHNDSITYGCHEGFQLVGQASITCRYGSWNYNIPECKGICGNPPDLHYAQLDFRFIDRTTFFAGDTVQYNCRPGYIQKYNHRSIIACLGNFSWSKIPNDFCNRISCGQPQKVRNAQFEAKDFLYESEVIYKCEKGYKLASGSNMVKCESNRRWVGTLPVCEVQKCLPPEDLEDGSYSLKKDEYTYNESVIYKCNTLRLVGKASVSCTDEGKWSSGVPQCKAVCTFPPKLDFAKVEEEFIQQEFFDHGTSVQYKCLPGFVPVISKNNKLTCLDDLKWSQHAVFCTPISCGHPGNITHGQMQSENFFFGSRVNYTCNPGYSMISWRNDRECQADGTWSGKPPVCKEPVCDKIWELQEEARKCTSTPDEWIKYLQVQYLYLQIENLKLDIEIKKRQLGAPL